MCSALKLAPGKELLGQLLPLADCTSPQALMRAVSRHTDIKKYSTLIALRQRILHALEISE